MPKTVATAKTRACAASSPPLPLITTVVFAVVLITGSVWLLAAQALVFAVATVFGMRNAPYGLIYRWLVRPRLGPPGELEPEAPPRVAQGTGRVISMIGVIG